MNDCFIYVSQVPRTGNAGQNKFEEGIIKSLLKKGKGERNFDIKIFSASLEGEKSEDDRLVFIPLSKKSYSGYISCQFRLLFMLGGYLWSRRKKNKCLFVRCHPALVVPLFLSYFFKLRMATRTGPVLPSLFYYKKNPGTVVYSLIKWMLGLHYKRCSAIVTVAEKPKQWLVDTFNLDPDKIKVIHNAADTSIFYREPPDRKKWGLPENEFVFGFTGTIDEPQGLDTVIEAMGLLKSKNENVPFVFLVGDGERRPRLQSLAEEKGVQDRIAWAGYIPHGEVRSAINACDMMLAPFQKKILDFKGSGPLKLWEYLACDKPVLASAHRDHQFMEDLNLGRTVEPDNPALWAEALAQESGKNNFRLEGRGEKFVAEGHSYDLLAEKFIATGFGFKSA